MKKNLKQSVDPTYIYLILCLLAGLFVVYAFTGFWPNKENVYNSYALQADSWLHGRLDLGQNYTHLELAIFKDKYFVSFPPFPSYLLLPFALIFGTKTPDHWIALFSFLLAGIYAVKLYKTVRGNETHAIFFTLFLLLGCNTLFSSVNGWVWFLAQNLAFTLSMMSLYYAHKGKLGLSLSLLACAVGCRPFQFVYVPIILIIYIYQWKEKEPKKFKKSDTLFTRIFIFVKQHITSFIAPMLIGISYMILNFARFGSIFEFGHNYLPEFTETTTGQFNTAYLATNFKSLFRLPKVSETGALSFYTFDGMAVWLVSPLFVTFLVYLTYTIVKSKKKSGMAVSAYQNVKREDMKKLSFNKKSKIFYIVLPCLMLLHIFCIISHKTMGGWHFGNRYLNDLLPFVYYGILITMPDEDTWVKWNYPLFILGICLNFVGSIATYNYWIS